MLKYNTINIFQITGSVVMVFGRSGSKPGVSPSLPDLKNQNGKKGDK
jgi:hypothetical protein